MKLRFWGVRGSRPTHRSDILGYGGHTTSMEFVLEDKDFLIFLDGGSGLSRYGRHTGEYTEKKKVYFLITHTHWDHILGFPYFKLFLNPKIKFTFFASTTSKARFSDLFLALQRSSHLQVPPFLMRSKLRFTEVKPETTFLIENCVEVKTHQINHQGITLSYRLQYKNSSVAIVTDNAPIENGNYLGEGMRERANSDPLAFEKEYNDSLVNFLEDTHTVVFDTLFTEKNLKADWGHSTTRRALEFCKKAKVKRMIIFHHSPEDSDSDLEIKKKDVKDEAKKYGLEVVIAREGEEWTLCE